MCRAQRCLIAEITRTLHDLFQSARRRSRIFHGISPSTDPPWGGSKAVGITWWGPSRG
jgi:hypothetical protein